MTERNCPFSQEELDDVLRQVEGSLQTRSEPRPVRYWPLLTAACVALLVATLVWSSESGPLRLADSDAPLFFRGTGMNVLSDGSSVTLRGGVQLSVVHNTSSRFRLAMSPGLVEFSVEPGGPRAWSIDTGNFVVDVIGTRFSIEQNADHGTVRVQRGHVRVRGSTIKDGFQILEGGMELQIDFQPADPVRIEESTEDLVERNTVDEGAGNENAEELEPSPGLVREPREGHRQGWRQLADRGAYHEAFQRVAPVFEMELRQARSVSELFRLADTARLSGHAARARSPLRRITREHPSDSRAGLAAFTLGKIEMDAGRGEQARRWLERALELGLSPSLSRAAYRRLESVTSGHP